MTFYAKWEANTYTVTVQNDGNGTGTATPASATMGEKITLTATTNSGYRFKEWQIVSGSVAISGDTFTMPADNVTVKAIFEKKSSVSSGGGGGGTTYYTLTLETNGGSSMKRSPRPTARRLTFPVIFRLATATTLVAGTPTRI